MSDTLAKLIRMANQIAEEFSHQQGANAAAATWDHLWHFWDPRMCDQIIAHLEAGGAGLSAVAHEAVAMLKERRGPAPQTPATHFGGVDAAGDTPGDAG